MQPASTQLLPLGKPFAATLPALASLLW